MIAKRSISTGRTGEQLAVKWLHSKGYKILFQNWRCGRLEIDVIAEKNGLLHCIEVKTRRSDAYGPPENLVSAKKLRNILRAAAKYLTENQCGEIQVDVLAVSIEMQKVEYFLFENIGCGSQR